MTLAAPFSRFYKRSCRVDIVNGRGESFSVENLDDDGVDIAFDLTRTDQPTPDRGVVRIANLASDERSRLEEWYRRDRVLDVVVNAGYDGTVETIFVGHAYQVFPSRYAAEDIVTELRLGDGLRGFRDADVQMAFSPTATLREALTALATTFQAGLVNEAAALDAETRKQLAATAAKPLSVMMGQGWVANGSMRAAMDHLTRAAGLRWWVRDGKLRLVPLGATTRDFVVVMAPGTGLRDGPDPVDEDHVRAVSMLNPQVFPGRRVVIVADDAQAPTSGALSLDSFAGGQVHRVVEARFVGDLASDPWDVAITAKREALPA